MSNNIQIRTIGTHSDIALLKLRGFLDTMSAYHLQKKGDELISQGLYKYIINLEQLEYISSAGIETFHVMVQELRQHSGEMIFVHVPEKIYNVFEIIGVTKFFRIESTVHDAVKELEAL